jgi:sn-glycerol 3-phosphate transport system substrate-binding protein
MDLTMDLQLETGSIATKRGLARARFTVAAALAMALTLSSSKPVEAAVTIEFWHAMNGELGRALDSLVANFNREQSVYHISAVYKGGYNETVTAAIFAVRTQSQPAVVQVNEIGTATMMAAKGAIYPVFELMAREGVAFDPKAFLPAISGYYADLDGKLLSFPFNASTPIMYYNKALFRAAGLDEDKAPKTWPEVEAAARRLRQSGAACGFTTHWPSWVNVENFSAYHNLPIATRANGLAGFDAELTIDNPVMIRHVAALAEWQKSKLFDYSGRETQAQPRFPSGQCAIFLGSSALRAGIIARARFAVGYGMLPYWPDVAGAPQNSIIGGATLWVLRGRSDEEYKGTAQFFSYLLRPQVQAAWHQNTGYLPATQAAYMQTRAEGYYDRNPGTAIAIEQLNLKPPTENSRGLRLGSFGLIRDVIEDELEAAFAGRKAAREALSSAVRRGDDLLRQFERATK